MAGRSPTLPLCRDRAAALGHDDQALAASLQDVAERCSRPEPLLGVRGDRKAHSMLSLLYGRTEGSSGPIWKLLNASGLGATALASAARRARDQSHLATGRGCGCAL